MKRPFHIRKVLEWLLNLGRENDMQIRLNLSNVENVSKFSPMTFERPLLTFKFYHSKPCAQKTKIEFENLILAIPVISSPIDHELGYFFQTNVPDVMWFSAILSLSVLRTLQSCSLMHRYVVAS